MTAEKKSQSKRKALTEKSGSKSHQLWSQLKPRRSSCVSCLNTRTCRYPANQSAWKRQKVQPGCLLPVLRGSSGGNQEAEGWTSAKWAFLQNSKHLLKNGSDWGPADARSGGRVYFITGVKETHSHSDVPLRSANYSNAVWPDEEPILGCKMRQNERKMRLFVHATQKPHAWP